MKFNEIHDIQCPHRKSFEEHIDNFDEVQKLVNKCDCSFTWKILSKSKFIFQIKIKAKSKIHHYNAFVQVIEFLKSRNIDRAEIIHEKKVLPKNISQKLEQFNEAVSDL